MAGEAPDRLQSQQAIGTSGDASFIVGRRGADLAQLLPSLPPQWTGDIITDGHWSLHEMVGYLLRLTGPAEAWLTTWGISTEPLQAILDMVRSGMITQLHLVLDHRVAQQARQAYQLLAGMSTDERVRIALTKCHAKLLVLHNSTHQLRCATSANLTNNPRIEHYTISTHTGHALGTRAIIDLVMQGGKPFSRP